MIKYFRRFLILIFILAAGYFFFGKENASSYTIPFISLSNPHISETLAKVSGGVKKYAGNIASSTISNLTAAATKKTQETISNIVAGAETQAFQVFRQSVNDKVNSVGANLGIDVQKLGTEITSDSQIAPVFFSVKAGAPSYFTIKNSEETGLDYEINWQDGESNKGSINKNETKLLSHAWSKAGEYELNFKTTNNAKTKEYKVTIFVF